MVSDITEWKASSIPILIKTDSSLILMDSELNPRSNTQGSTDY